jgi:hypothetical protein
MSQTEYEAALSEFLRSKSVTRCPTACVAPTHATVPDTDRAALRRHEDALEVERLEMLFASSRSTRQRPLPMGSEIIKFHFGECDVPLVV